MIYKSYRYRIYPTEVQKQTLAQHFGAVRFVFNWGLETKKKAWDESRERVSWTDLSAQLTIKRKELDWLEKPSRSVLVGAIRSLETGFQRYFKGQGHPKFKTRKSKQSLTYCSEAFKSVPVNFDTNKINIPKIGPVKCVVSRRFDGKFKALNITKTPTGKYFASCMVELPDSQVVPPVRDESNAIGIDLGLRRFATMSDGKKIKNPKFFNRGLRTIRRASKRFSRKKADSKNKEKSRLKYARIHEKISNQRNNFLQKVTTKLIRDNQAKTICIEELNVKAMCKFGKLPKHIHDAGFATFRVMLTYKAEWNGVNLLTAPLFAPTSRLCTCDHKNEKLTLEDHFWTCDHCGQTHDRDLLAANNIIRFAFHPEIKPKEKIGRGTPEYTPTEIAGYGVDEVGI